MNKYSISSAALLLKSSQASAQYQEKVNFHTSRLATANIVLLEVLNEDWDEWGIYNEQ